MRRFHFIQSVLIGIHASPTSALPPQISFINAGGVLGRLIPNFLADRVGSFNILIPVTFLTASSILALLGSIDVGGIIFISLLYGAMNAGCELDSRLARINNSPGLNYQMYRSHRLYSLIYPRVEAR